MKKIALIFVLAVLVPSLVLAWLALRSLRDQQLVLERQQSLLCQGIADKVAAEIAAYLATEQREFSAQVETILGKRTPVEAASNFDEELRKAWPLAKVGFVVSLDGRVLAPSL